MWRTTRLHFGAIAFLVIYQRIPECSQKSTRPRLFADDTNLTASGLSIAHIENAVNFDPETLRNSLIANKLSLNVFKTNK